MNETEFLKERIKSEQEKLNDLLKSGDTGMLALDETTEMSRELDKLIVEFLILQRNKNQFNGIDAPSGNIANDSTRYFRKDR